jgi:hypothetical protein
MRPATKALSCICISKSMSKRCLKCVCASVRVCTHAHSPVARKGWDKRILEGTVKQKIQMHTVWFLFQMSKEWLKGSFQEKTVAMNEVGSGGLKWSVCLYGEPVRLCFTGYHCNGCFTILFTKNLLLLFDINLCFVKTMDNLVILSWQRTV